MTANSDFVVLITAKSPVPGKVKTRLTPPLTPRGAARLAAAALVDTVEAASAAVEHRRERIVISLAGSPESAVWPSLADDLAGCTVIAQVGDGFGQRLRHAHESAAGLFPGLPVVQVGMDTPQVSADMLREAAAHLVGQVGQVDAVLGPASDGGWWLLGLRTPDAASVLPGVPMSTDDTGRRTRQALTDLGLTVLDLPVLTDIDTYQDAVDVRQLCDGTHFATVFDKLPEP